jgi:hypothetical protein
MLPKKLSKSKTSTLKISAMTTPKTDSSPWPDRVTGASPIAQAKSQLEEIAAPVIREIKHLLPEKT